MYLFRRMSFSDMWSFTLSGSGCLLTPAEDLVKQASSQSLEREVGCPPPAAVLCPHNHPSPCCKREPGKLPCFLTTANKFTKAGGSRALVIHILASATADVALISTAPVYLCLPCWSNDKNWEHSIFPIKTHNTCCWRASGRKIEGNKRQLYPGHSLLYFNYQIFIYCVLLMTLWLKKHAWS